MDKKLRFIKGIGPKRLLVFNQAGIETIEDLIEVFPRRYLDRSTILPLDQISKNEEVTVIGKIEAAGIRRARKPYFYLIISDGKGILEAVWFHYATRYQSIFKVGEWISLSGKITFYRKYQMVHPDFDKIGENDFDDKLNTGRIIPLYPGSEAYRKVGINSYTFRRIFKEIFTGDQPKITENLPSNILKKYHFPDRLESFRTVHLPLSKKRLEQSIERFKYEELFFVQLMLAIQKRYLSAEVSGLSFEQKSVHLEDLYHRLPFSMTEAQKRVMREIRCDMKEPHPMNRLLQGDVGSGKTIVALMAMLIAIDNHYQAALMAPTEILAEQHFLNFSELLKSTDIPVLLLTGSSPVSERNRIKEKISARQPLVLIGTHALIQEDISFSKLGLIVIDEQHRFGVVQRAALIEKGIHSDVLIMTATPIPRTMALTVYGNLDVSVLDELPPNRPNLITIWRTEEKSEEINDFIRKKVNNGEQVYIVYPLVAESEKTDLKAATESYHRYKRDTFSDYRIALLHGRLKSSEKEQIMREFQKGHINILFSTTVIEVGIDVPNATVMVIEHAERFGLSQLHQLRGRIGRGTKKSYCILKSTPDMTDIARRRLQIMTTTRDGFEIAEEDMRLRGWGDFFGTRQHGLPNFKLANPLTDRHLLMAARGDAFELISSDPQLRTDRNQSLRNYFLAHYKENLHYFNVR